MDTPWCIQKTENIKNIHNVACKYDLTKHNPHATWHRCFTLLRQVAAPAALALGHWCSAPETVKLAAASWITEMHSIISSLWQRRLNKPAKLGKLSKIHKDSHEDFTKKDLTSRCKQTVRSLQAIQPFCWHPPWSTWQPPVALLQFRCSLPSWSEAGNQEKRSVLMALTRPASVDRKHLELNLWKTSTVHDATESVVFSFHRNLLQETILIHSPWLWQHFYLEQELGCRDRSYADFLYMLRKGLHTASSKSSQFLLIAKQSPSDMCNCAKWSNSAAKWISVLSQMPMVIWEKSNFYAWELLYIYSIYIVLYI